jgi:diguanylate cyclase (GGDEF)-like protein
MSQEWVVILEAANRDRAPVDDDFLDRLLEQVRDCKPRALHATDRYALQLLLAAESGLEAHSIAMKRWRRALSAIGGPVWAEVRVEVLTRAEFEQDLAMAAFADEPAWMEIAASAEGDSHRLLRSVFEDPLTHLGTGAIFRAKVESTLRPAQPRGTAHALLMLQLTDRVAPASTPGHADELDDVVVLEVVRRLTEIVRRDDIMARLDRDMFAVLAKGMGTQGAAALARRASDILAEAVSSTGTWGHIGIHVGIALSETGWNADRLFAAADLAVGSAKTAPEGWALFREETSGSARLTSDALEADERADGC